MPYASAKDGCRLFYEEAGSGTSLIFIHEFAGDHRSWEPQMRFFARYFHCITYAARGFPPSDIPDDPTRYSQDQARDDIIAVLDHLKLERAHVVGLSMGGFAALHVGIAYPHRVRSLIIAGCGYGAEPDKKEKFQAECDAAAAFSRLPGPKRRSDTPSVRRGCSSRTRIRAAGPSSRSSLASIRRRARRSPCAACRCAARRSTS